MASQGLSQIRRSGEVEPLWELAEEVAVAVTFNGSTHAVMMATPSDLEDFALGFALTEGVLRADSPLPPVEILSHPNGIEARIHLQPEDAEAFRRRRRALAGPVGCGLCGIESLDEAVRSVPSVHGDSLRLTPADIRNAVSALDGLQPLRAATHATHAAGFVVPGEGVAIVREDVGRHNALDKLIGALLQDGIDRAEGAIVLTSRVSVELVQKAAAAGVPAIIAVSAPSALAVRTAEAANITLVANVRGERSRTFSHGRRIGLPKVERAAKVLSLRASRPV